MREEIKTIYKTVFKFIRIITAVVAMILATIGILRGFTISKDFFLPALILIIISFVLLFKD